MICPNCGTETVHILGEEYCSKCSKRIPATTQEIPKEQHSFKKSIKLIAFGFLSTVFLIFLSFTIVTFITSELSPSAKSVLLILTGFSAAFVGGAVSVQSFPKNDIKNALILALTLAFVNSLFNFFSDYNLLRWLESFLLGALLYAIPCLIGALFFQRFPLFKD